MKAKIRQFIGLFLLVVYAFFFTSTNLFYHSHQLDNSILVHSHPFSGHGHSHTSGQILLIGDINSASYQESDEIIAPDCIPVLFRSELLLDRCSQVISRAFLSFSLRAPPTSC